MDRNQHVFSSYLHRCMASVILSCRTVLYQNQSPFMMTTSLKIESDSEIVLTRLYSWDILHSLPARAIIKIKTVSAMLDFKHTPKIFQENKIQFFKCFFVELMEDPVKYDEYCAYFGCTIGSLPSLQVAKFFIPEKFIPKAKTLIDVLENIETKYHVSLTTDAKYGEAITFIKK
jgi:hypothetical protein